MIRKATNSDSRVLAEMAVQMWDDNTVNELETEFLKTLNDEQSAFFIVICSLFSSSNLYFPFFNFFIFSIFIIPPRKKQLIFRCN